jgi:hypothetical protein
MTLAQLLQELENGLTLICECRKCREARNVGNVLAENSTDERAHRAVRKVARRKAGIDALTEADRPSA